MSETRSGNPVTVGCKLPNGLVLKVGESSVILKGASSARVIGGYGLTSVPTDMWNAWLKSYADSPLVRNNLVFAQTTADKAEGQAKEQAEVRTGLEPLDPNKPAPGIQKAEK